MEGYILLQQAQQIFPILIVIHRSGLQAHIFFGDVSQPIGNLLRAGDHHTLAIFHRLDEVCSL